MRRCSLHSYVGQGGEAGREVEDKGWLWREGSRRYRGNEDGMRDK